MALEELMIAEGSDWCWWYGPEHDSANRVEFDQLYRSHLANVYRFLDLCAAGRAVASDSADGGAAGTGSSLRARFSPRIDGEVTSFFEWLGAGLYRADERSGSMHGKKFLVKDVHFGSDGDNLYLRVDFHPGNEDELSGLELRLNVRSMDETAASSAIIRADAGRRASEAASAGKSACGMRVRSRARDCAFP